MEISSGESERQVPLAAAGGLLRALCEVGAEGERPRALLRGAPGGEDAPLAPERALEAANRALRVLDRVVLVRSSREIPDDLVSRAP